MRGSNLTSLALLTALFMFGCGETGSTLGSLNVETEYGSVEGFENDGVLSFRGIPYAAPPIGELRWKPPQAPEPWTETLEAKQKGAPCAQDLSGGLPLPDLFVQFLSSDEDCLTVNVDRPARGSGLPVMVWIHGGAFTLGEGLQADGGTAGDRIARTTDTVVVSMNYRLGQFGFLAHSALTAESPENASGNYGMLDQTFALEWVRDNIEGFGGDPNNVTIFGESAGAFSVCGHLASALSAGLFHKAILQSGSCERTFTPQATAEEQGDAFSLAIGCSEASDDAAVLSCMRGKTADEVLAALPPLGNFGLVPSGESGGLWGPTLDGYFHREQPAELFESGDFNQVPTIIGFNEEEGRLFTWLADISVEEPPAIDESNYVAAVQNLLRDEDLTALAVAEPRYELSETNSAFDAYSAFMTDTVFRCPSRQEAKKLSSHVDTYLYQFEYPDGRFQLEALNDLVLPIEIPELVLPEGGLGAFHSADIPYVFGYSPLFGVDIENFGTVLNPLPDGADDALWQATLGYWTRFAATGDPNGGGALEWPKYTADGDGHLVLDSTIAAATGAAAGACAFWDEHPEYLTPVFGN